MSNAIHISLNVSDLSRSADFYRRFFGEPRKLKSVYA
jgi:catechol 2,3-dioxygenase-like lactoylglutathione lyase family enzyme